MPTDLFTAGGNSALPPFILDIVVEAHEDAILDETTESELAPASEVRPPWERQAGEPSRAYHAFCHYRDLKVRSARLAFINHKKACEQTVVNPQQAPKRWMVWSAQWGWVDRSARWDAELDRQHREAVSSEQLEARKRHARQAQAVGSALMVPTRSVLTAIADPAVLQTLENHAKLGSGALLQVLSTVIRVAQVLPGVINSERLALGLTTESFEVDDKRDSIDAIATRIVESPKATQLAVDLLNEIATKGAPATQMPNPAVLELPAVPPDEPPTE